MIELISSFFIIDERNLQIQKYIKKRRLAIIALLLVNIAHKINFKADIIVQKVQNK